MQKFCHFFFSLLIISLLTGCYSSSNYPSPNPERIPFGASYQDRQYFSHPIQQVNYIDYQPITEKNPTIVNHTDFLTQLDYIYQSAKKFIPTFATTYNKVSQWLAEGADLTQLQNFNLETHQLAGVDGYQNVLLTGYYSPVIEARKKKQGKFRYPIYAMPKKGKYSRTQIYAGALKGKKLEIAYTSSLIDNFLLGVQGSGYLDLGKGKLTYLAYAGKNGYPYTSIGRVLVEQNQLSASDVSIPAIHQWAEKNPTKVRQLLEKNQSFVFFTPKVNKLVIGAAGVPLVPLTAVAADRNLVPLGSVLLVEMPILTATGKWSGQHQLRLMVALDVGGAIKGQHFDLYQGIGKQAGFTAGHLRHYGRVWIIK